MTSIDNQPTGTRENAAARRVKALELREWQAAPESVELNRACRGQPDRREKQDERSHAATDGPRAGRRLASGGTTLRHRGNVCDGAGWGKDGPRSGRAF